MHWISVTGIFVIAALVTQGGSVSKCSGKECSHTCDVVSDKPLCTCPLEMTLGTDGKTCLVTVGILLAMFREVRLYSEGYSEPRTIATAKVKAVDYHYKREEIYAYTDGNIVRFSLSAGKTGSSQQAYVVLPLNSAATSLAVDWVNDRLYWVSKQKSAVESATLDGTDKKVILAHNNTDESPHWNNIVIDPYIKKLFWLGSEGLYSANVDGTDLQKLSSGRIQAEDIALDTRNKLIYLIGSHGHDSKKYIGRRHYDGSFVGEDSVISQSGTKVFGFGVVGKEIYWQSNYDGESLHKGHLADNGQIEDVKLVEELYQIVYDMKIYHPDLQQPKK